MFSFIYIRNTHVYTRTYKHVHLCVCVYVCVHTCMCVGVCTYMYMYTNTLVQNGSYPVD